MDVSLAGWLLSLAAFVAGTIMPFIYRTFFHQGISMKPLTIKASMPSSSGKTITFGTAIRIASVNRGSVLIDDVRVPTMKMGGQRFRLESSLLADVTKNKTISIPPKQTDQVEVLPLVLNPNAVQVYVLILESSFDSGDLDYAAALFGKAALDKSIPIRIRINGIYRRYRLNFDDAQQIWGYKVAVGELPDSATRS